MNTSEVLNKAADLIEERGWTTGPKGMLVNGPHCALGAIGAVVGAETRVSYFANGVVWSYVSVEATPAAKALRRHIAHWPRIESWNDGHVHAAPVIEALRAAAVIEQAREDSESKVEVPA